MCPLSDLLTSLYPPTNSLIVFVQFIENELTLEFHSKLTQFYNQQSSQSSATPSNNHHHNTAALLAYLRIVQLIKFLRTNTLLQEMEDLRDSLIAFITENDNGENSNLEENITNGDV